MNRTIQILLLSTSMILIAIESHPLGLGVHLTGGAVLYRGYDEDEDPDYPFFGGGFVLDTAVAKNNLFNYRMQLDYTNHMSWASIFISARFPPSVSNAERAPCSRRRPSIMKSNIR